MRKSDSLWEERPTSWKIITTVDGNEVSRTGHQFSRLGMRIWTMIELETSGETRARGGNRAESTTCDVLVGIDDETNRCIVRSDTVDIATLRRL